VRFCSLLEGCGTLGSRFSSRVEEQIAKPLAVDSTRHCSGHPIPVIAGNTSSLAASRHTTSLRHMLRKRVIRIFISLRGVSSRAFTIRGVQLFETCLYSFVSYSRPETCLYSYYRRRACTRLYPTLDPGGGPGGVGRASPCSPYLGPFVVSTSYTLQGVGGQLPLSDHHKTVATSQTLYRHDCAYVITSHTLRMAT
jgi:hypothetical protein